MTDTENDQKELSVTDDELIEAIRPDSTRDTSPAIQIRDNLERLIENGTLEDGRRMPVERRLSEALGVSRLVVRQSLDSLQGRGAVARRQGSGTYVTSAKIEGNLHLLSGFSDELRGQRSVSTRIVQFGYCAPDPAVQDTLEIPADAMSAIRLIRVRSIDDVPSTYETSWLPARIAQHLLNEDLTNISLFQLLAETKGVVPDHATEKLRCTALDERDAAQLGTHVGAPAFLVNRTTYDKDGVPIEYVETLLRGDRFFYATTLEAPHRLPGAAERLSRFETLAEKPR